MHRLHSKNKIYTVWDSELGTWVYQATEVMAEVKERGTPLLCGLSDLVRGNTAGGVPKMLGVLT